MTTELLNDQDWMALKSKMTTAAVEHCGHPDAWAFFFAQSPYDEVLPQSREWDVLFPAWDVLSDDQKHSYRERARPTYEMMERLKSIKVVPSHGNV